MPVVKFQPPHSQSCGRITVASLGYKQVGRVAAAAGLATLGREAGGVAALLHLLCFPVSGSGGLSVAVRFWGQLRTVPS